MPDLGYENLIDYHPSDGDRRQQFQEQLANPVVDGWAAFTVAAGQDGVYFCDHGWTSAAAIALRRIIDEAMTKNGAVTIREL